MRMLCVAVLAVVASVAPALGQALGDRQKARLANKTGWDLMKAESFEKAVVAFQQSIELDPTFDMSFYGLGRAHLALKHVSAISALSRCRDLYVAQVGRQFTSQQEAQRYRQDRITELDEMLRQLDAAPQSAQVQDQKRQVTEHKRQLQELITRGNDTTTSSSVPAWVSLSLGSAYFVPASSLTRKRITRKRSLPISGQVKHTATSRSCIWRRHGSPTRSTKSTRRKKSASK